MVDRDDLMTIARLNNAATNGRAFNALMFFLVLVISDRAPAAVWLAFFPIISIGAAYIADSFAVIAGRISTVFALASVAAAVLPLISVLYLF